ncbi:MAG: hypothetical protein ACJ70W_02565, partial [Nitrososphaera sp.]
MRESRHRRSKEDNNTASSNFTLFSRNSRLCVYILKPENAIKGWQELVIALIFVKAVPYLTIS